jgi:CubicO group peptidase (beta-lactamase class C family)
MRTKSALLPIAYNLLHQILESASGKSVDQLTKEKIADRIGMTNWSWTDYNLELTTRDMARFGILIDNKGTWNGSQILTDAKYFSEMTSSSSSLNKAYGYLWWLNGKDSYMVPMENDVKPGSLVSTAPAEMFAAMGKGDKKIYVIPSKHLVIVRHGDDTGNSTFGPSSFDTELWSRMSAIIGGMKEK